MVDIVKPIDTMADIVKPNDTMVAQNVIPPIPYRGVAKQSL